MVWFLEKVTGIEKSTESPENGNTEQTLARTGPVHSRAADMAMGRAREMTEAMTRAMSRAGGLTGELTRALTRRV